MRGMLTLVAICALAVSQLPNNRTTAAASDGVTYAGAVALNDVAPTDLSNADVIALYTLHEAEIAKLWVELGAATTMREAVVAWMAQSSADPCPVESEPLTVCTDAGCYVVRSGPVRSGPVRSVVRTTTRVVTAPVRVVYAARQRQVFRSSERFMQRGPARRLSVRAARAVTAPIRWLRCR